MSKIKNFFENGEIQFNLQRKFIDGQYILHVERGLWYKFNIDNYEELEDGTFNVYSHTLVSIDDKLVH